MTGELERLEHLRAKGWYVEMSALPGDITVVTYTIQISMPPLRNPCRYEYHACGASLAEIIDKLEAAIAPYEKERSSSGASSIQNTKP